MITIPSGVRVLVATKPVDFRKGGEGLAALVREALGEDPFSGTIFVFRCKRADRVKIVAWDGSGLVLFWKRLEQGAFRWPPICDGTIRLSASQLAALVDEFDPCGLEGSPNDFQRGPPWLTCSSFQLMDGDNTNPGFRREILLVPAQQSACRPGLFRRNHRRRMADGK